MTFSQSDLPVLFPHSLKLSCPILSRTSMTRSNSRSGSGDCESSSKARGFEVARTGMMPSSQHGDT